MPAVFRLTRAGKNQTEIKSILIRGDGVDGRLVFAYFGQLVFVLPFFPVDEDGLDEASGDCMLGSAELQTCFDGMPSKSKSKRTAESDPSSPRPTGRAKGSALFPGLQRTAATAAYARMARRSNVAIRKGQQRTAAFDRLADAWDSHVALRSGDKVDRTAIMPAKAAKDSNKFEKVKWVHANHLDLAAVIRLGFANVGKHARLTSSHVQPSSHGLPALVSTARLSHVATQARVADLVTSKSIRSLLVTKHHDATPIHVTFGKMQEQLVPHARFLVRDKATQRWTSVPFAVLVSDYGARSAPQRGVVELFGQYCKITFMTTEGELHSRDIDVPPCVLQHMGASNIYTAVEKMVPSLSTEKLKSMVDANELEWVMLCETVDNHGANLRKMTFTALQLPQRILFFGHGCDVHRLTRIIASALPEAKLLGDIYSVRVVTSLTSHYNTLCRELHKLIEEELVVFDAQPSTESQAHASRVLKVTVQRREQLRGRLSGNDFEHVESRHHDLLKQRVRNLVDLLGDIRIPCLTHYERGCCAHGRQESVDKLYAAILDAGLVQGLCLGLISSCTLFYNR